MAQLYLHNSERSYRCPAVSLVDVEAAIRVARAFGMPDDSDVRVSADGFCCSSLVVVEREVADPGTPHAAWTPAPPRESRPGPAPVE